MTEKKLFLAFDQQRFAPSARLQAVIDAAHERTKVRELGEDELEEVAAAGVPWSPKKSEESWD